MRFKKEGSKIVTDALKRGLKCLYLPTKWKNCCKENKP